MVHVNEHSLNDRIFDAVRSAGKEISIQELEKLLHDEHIEVGRADLRAALWQLYAAKKIDISPHSKIAIRK